MIKEITVAVVSAAVIAITGYILVIKENQLKIEFLTEKIAELKEISTNTQGSLNATKLFIASAHPKRDISSLASLEKLKDATPSEYTILGTALAKENIKFGVNNEIKTTSPQFRAFIAKYDLNKNDIETYSIIAKASEANEIKAQ